MRTSLFNEQNSRGMINEKVRSVINDEFTIRIQGIRILGGSTSLSREANYRDLQHKSVQR